MTYLDVANMTTSTSLLSRLSAAAAEEQTGGAVLIPDFPEQWASVNRWKLCAAPGWADAWASAEASDPGGDHGSDDSVITDAMILSQVQAVLGD